MTIIAYSPKLKSKNPFYRESPRQDHLVLRKKSVVWHHDITKIHPPIPQRKMTNKIQPQPRKESAQYHRLNLPEIPVESWPQIVTANPSRIQPFGPDWNPPNCNWVTPMKTEFVMITNAKKASNCQASTWYPKFPQKNAGKNANW